MIKKIGALLAVFLFAAPAVSYFKYRRHSEPTRFERPALLCCGRNILAPRPPGPVRYPHVRRTKKKFPTNSPSNPVAVETEQKQFRVLQPASAGGKTQFLLDMSGVPEYDRVNLKLATKNFVAHARVEGQDDLHGTRWALLGTTTLYDLTDEKLGDNSTLQIPLSAYNICASPSTAQSSRPM